MTGIFVKQALLPEGWRKNVSLVIGPDGRFSSVTADSQPSRGMEQYEIALPPQISLHSHAFQRGMAGFAERRQTPSDTFWTWRTLMYQLAGHISPDQMEGIAAFLYMEMLRAGYTQVAEFHYLHRDKNGSAYNQPAEMAMRIAAGAQTAGLGVTVLPTLYMYAGFGQRPLQDEQQRFASTPGFIAEIISDLRKQWQGSSLVSVGLGLHSLRAVGTEDINALVSAVAQSSPVHIHIAEQIGEVEQCLAATGQRPVAWLFEHVPVDARWCLIHATHLTSPEVTRIAKSQAVAGLCPVTEANLGDGFFPFVEYVAKNGRFGIGSDSNILISPAEELRLLEYGMRLSAQSRCLALPQGELGSTGGWLYRQAQAGGAQACGLAQWGLTPGARADLCVPDETQFIHPDLEGDAVLDAALFTLPALPVRHVMSAGEWRVRDGHHPQQERLTQHFRTIMREIFS
ncbi:formimidoylglutamate deiminase [Acetobacter thailandicus]|uniref:formimidoylglutamate deiminase n=1 Tax=Acetobacter thailandicus TaxID=1502842 RepID=UPI001BAAA0EA|nr:formimidoylglutamate deiminase [Acetobacter thailandicus]MBS0960474.1 formimidoylglutamate deiminase [Acetobacter thailandicus]